MNMQFIFIVFIPWLLGIACYGLILFKMMGFI